MFGSEQSEDEEEMQLDTSFRLVVIVTTIK